MVTSADGDDPKSEAGKDTKSPAGDIMIPVKQKSLEKSYTLNDANDDNIIAGSICGTNPWNSILNNTGNSSTASNTITGSSSLLWNVNQLFRHGFRVDNSDADQESTLDNDARRLLERFPANMQPFSDESITIRRKELLLRFLQFDTPRLTDSMLAFLSSDAVLEMFLQFIVRLPTNNIASSNRFEFHQPLSALEAMESCRQDQRNFDELEAQKLSYRVMTVLCQANQATKQLFGTRLREIVLRLFNVFQPQSRGNFYHVRQIFKFLLQLEPRQLIEILIAPTPAFFQVPSDSHESLKEQKAQSPLILNALPYAREPAVAEMIMDILYYADPNENGKVSEIRLRSFRILREHKFIEYLIDLITIEDPEDKYATEISGVTDLIVRIFEQGVDCKESKLLLANLSADPEVIMNLYQRLHNADEQLSSSQRANMIRVLHSICVKAQNVLPRPPSLQQIAYRKFIHNSSSALAELSLDCNELLARKISDICRIFTRGFMRPLNGVKLSDEDGQSGCETFKFSAYKVQHFMTAAKLQFLEIFARIFRAASKESALLDQVPSTLWAILTDWFFEFRFHNAYHCQFFSIIYQVLESNHRGCLKNCIGKTKLIPRMVAHFNDYSNPTGCRGYITLISNYIRLSGEQQGPNDYISQLLSSTAEWKEFLSVLQRETLRQVQPLVPFRVNNFSIPQPTPHFGPLVLASSTSTTESIFDPLSPSPMKAKDRGGIHLGSLYALALGFAQPSKSSLPAEASNISSFVESSSSPSEKSSPGRKTPGSNGRKKKKKSGVNENLSHNSVTSD